MTKTEKQHEFIRLRAEELPYTEICSRLHIAKATCSKWNKELQNEITETRTAGQKALKEAYMLSQEQKIRSLTATLEKIDKALETADLSKTPPERLMKLRLDYLTKLNELYTPPTAHKDVENAGEVIDGLNNILARVRAGELTTEQAKREAEIISVILKAYDTLEIKQRLEQLEVAIEERTRK